MTLLYPSLQAERIRSAVVDYLSTTFALTDAESRSALADFLESPERGVFTGPFVRLRLPYQPSRAAATSPPSTPPAAPTSAPASPPKASSPTATTSATTRPTSS